MIVVLIGVSGSGKTTIGETFAAQRGWKFVDADNLHSPENKEKMRAGIPLTDEDRAPWLESLRQVVRDTPQHTEVGSNEHSTVLVFSGLKRRYREFVRDCRQDLVMVTLAGSFETLAERMSVRVHEYMNPSLLKSQFDTWEPPSPEEKIETIIVEDPPESVVARLAEIVQLAQK